MSEAPRTVWVTKYALTRGVVERPVHASVAHGAAMICRHCRGRGWSSAGIYGWDPCDCGEDEVEIRADEPEDEQNG